MNWLCDKIDREAEREGKALSKQEQLNCQQGYRQRIKTNHNKVKFDKLFKGK